MENTSITSYMSHGETNLGVQGTVSGVQGTEAPAAQHTTRHARHPTAHRADGTGYEWGRDTEGSTASQI